MNFINVTCFSNQCIGKEHKLEGSGGTFSPNLTVVKLTCPHCNVSIAIIPMDKESVYAISVKPKP